MQEVTVSAKGYISYTLLKNYHPSAQAIYEIRTEKDQPLEIDYEYEIDVMAEDEQHAKDIFIDYLKKLNSLGIALHAGNLAYLVKNIISGEGSLLYENAVENEKINGDLFILSKLLKIQEENQFEDLNLELTSKKFSNKQFLYYTKIRNEKLVKESVNVMINALFNEIKADYSLHTFQIWNLLSKIETPTSENIQSLLSLTERINQKNFKGDLLYTICRVLLKYLDDNTSLNPDGVAMTEDQLRVVHSTCKLHGLLDRTHEIESEELNYLRTYITNRKTKPLMIAKIVDDSLSAL